MKAAIYKQYGDTSVLSVSDVKKPQTESKDLLIKINYSSVTSGDWRLRKAKPFATRFVSGIIKPKHPILGHEFAGVVESKGSQVTKFKVGDRVFGSTNMVSGTHAEYIKIGENDIVAKSPENISDGQLAAIPVGALTALFFIRKMDDLKGKSILIYGASGSVGTYAIQFAKLFGANVTSVSSTNKIEAIKSLGSDQVFDYKKQKIENLAEKFDFVFDAVGKSNYNIMKRLLKPKGKFITVAINFSLLFQSFLKSSKVKLGITKQTQKDLELISELVAKGKILPVIDREYSLNEIRDAHNYVEKGHKLGNVILSIN